MGTATTTIRVTTAARYRGLAVTVLGDTRAGLLAIAGYGTAAGAGDRGDHRQAPARTARLLRRRRPCVDGQRRRRRARGRAGTRGARRGRLDMEGCARFAAELGIRLRRWVSRELGLRVRLDRGTPSSDAASTGSQMNGGQVTTLLAVVVLVAIVLLAGRRLPRRLSRWLKPRWEWRWVARFLGVVFVMALLAAALALPSLLIGPDAIADAADRAKARSDLRTAAIGRWES